MGVVDTAARKEYPLDHVHSLTHPLTAGEESSQAEQGDLYSPSVLAAALAGSKGGTGDNGESHDADEQQAKYLLVYLT